MDIVTLGAALNGSAEYVNSHFVGGSNIQIVDNPDGTQTINASGEVSSEDTVARAEIAAIKDGENIDSFGDVETALDTKANTSTTYTKTEVDTALSAKANSADVYSKTAVDTALGNKADKSTTYTKTEVDTALANKVDKETGKGLSTNDYTTAEKTKLAGIAEGAEVNVQSNWTQTTTTADDYIKNKPTLGTAAAKNATDTYNATGTDVTTGKAVAEALATLPEPMIFKGSLGTGGTITALPTASSSNEGYVYKVITAGTYASQSAKVGDTFISDGSAWVLIPSGDEPSGTVTNVAVANGGGLTVSGSPITSSGTITVGHSNSVTAKTSSSLKKFTYDAYGHVTGSSELSTAESDALASGIDSTKVAQIETNKNNILYNTNNGVKNLYDYANSDLAYKASSCTATKSANGISVSSSGAWAFASYPMTLKSGTYKLVCTVSDLVIEGGQVRITIGTNAQATGETLTTFGVSSNGEKISDEFTIQSDSTVYLTLYINQSNQNKSNSMLVSNIMIIPSNIDDTSYQPYALSNATITPALQECVDNGKKQLLQFHSDTNGALVATAQSNGYSVIITGGDDAVGKTVSYADCTIEKTGSYTFRCDLSGTGASCYIYDTITATQIKEYYATSSETLTLTGGHTYQIKTYRKGSGTNATVEAMLCEKSLYDVSPAFEPYAMSNVELTAKEQQNENNILSLLTTSYSSPTLIDGTTCTINEGGYITVGNIIVVNVTFTTSASYTAYSPIMQFQVPKNSGSITMVAAAHIDSSVNVAVNKYGQLALFDTPLPAGTYHFFTVYLKQ